VVERGTKLVVASRGSGGGAGQLDWPVSGRRLTSPFGARKGGYHTGLDIDGNTGDPVSSIESGKVIFAAYSGGYGNIIKIDHGDGLQTWYAHLSKMAVSAGSTVEKGQYIGDVGSTGRSTGSHLHLEIRINGSPYNPINYLK
jgi:murein DD-endopeptidase MepM/ murein hydrolase activator NlpD